MPPLPIAGSIFCQIERLKKTDKNDVINACHHALPKISMIQRKIAPIRTAFIWVPYCQLYHQPYHQPCRLDDFENSWMTIMPPIIIASPIIAGQSGNSLKT